MDLRTTSFFVPNFHFHGDGAYFRNTHSGTGTHDKHFFDGLLLSSTDRRVGFAPKFQFICQEEWTLSDKLISND